MILYLSMPSLLHYEKRKTFEKELYFNCDSLKLYADGVGYRKCCMRYFKTCMIKVIKIMIKKIKSFTCKAIPNGSQNELKPLRALQDVLKIFKVTLKADDQSY